MKKQNRFFLTVLFAILSLTLLTSSLHLGALPTHPAPGSEASEVKVNTNYWAIEAMDTFNAKATSVTFHHPNTGNKKVKDGFQVVAITFSLHNPGNALVRVPRSYFLVNKKKNNNKIVAIEGSSPKVVKVPAGKVNTMTNYYIVEDKATKLEDLKVVYSSATRRYKKYKVFIPLTQEAQK
ncbi:MAG: hypothetical protein GY940_25050 [bacterium]|nr:hypothetical protein [bacterium]